MNLFQFIIDEVRNVEGLQNARGFCREWSADGVRGWPAAGPRDIVLLPDLAVELGSPDQASVSFMVWTDEAGRVQDNRIALIGPDIGETERPRLPFGKVLLVQTDPCAEDLYYDRCRDLDLVRFDLSLKGYMLRASSQYLKEWIRISQDAVNQGFSLSILGAALVASFKVLPYVRAVEVLFITRSCEDVKALYEPAEKTVRLVQAMNKMVVGMEVDCGSCEYQDVCRDAADMQALRKTLDVHRRSLIRGEA